MARLGFVLFALPCLAQWKLEAPRTVLQWEIAEFVLRQDQPAQGNPFTDLILHGDFRLEKEPPRIVSGFVDSPDGRVLRLRFSPDRGPAVWRYRLTLRGPGVDRRFEGELRSEASTLRGPVIADPDYPKHFLYAGSRKLFFHLGYTAYHLLDLSNDDAQVDATIDYCARLGFNKIRFLLTGYPRDSATAASGDREHGVPDAARRPNYGARPGRLNPLPAWEGSPHAYDFSRFHVAHWQRVDRAVRRMRDRGVLATAIVTIEKQNLSAEYGRLTPHEIQLYRYAAARLGAFDNIWFDLGNEHNEFRDPAWGEAMGASLRALEPHGRMISAHGYADFAYTRSPWAGFLITQQYGTPRQLYDWAIHHRGIAKPYVNEEYGYEANQPKPGHLQNGGLTRRGHWAISMAGGYASYGDWSDGVAWFYMGIPGPGVAAGQLQHLRRFFESLPFRELAPVALSSEAFCLARLPNLFVVYFPQGGAEVDFSAASRDLASRWFDPRTGDWSDGPRLRPRRQRIDPPNAVDDWALVAR